MNANCNNTCRFCYSYKPPGPIDVCCETTNCASEGYISSISSQPNIVNNSTRTSERTLLLQQQRQYLLDVAETNMNSTIQNTINNSSIITSTIYGQLLGVRQQRYEPYQPYIPPVIPAHVMQLQMNTVNVGVPMSFFTMADCKGVQSVTT
jgi:hypothetical protein